MTIEFDQLARSASCDSGHLRSAVALLRQGYHPSFLARYRRDELGGIAESALWIADQAVRAEERITKRKSDLERRAQMADPSRPSVDSILRDASHDYELDLAARLFKAPALDATDAHRLALRMIRPMAGDDSDPAKVVGSVLGNSDPVRTEAALAGWVDALPDLLAHDLRILRAAAHWLDRNARVQIGEITEPQHDTPEAADDSDELDAADSHESHLADDIASEGVDSQIESAQIANETQQIAESQETADLQSEVVTAETAETIEPSAETNASPELVSSEAADSDVAAADESKSESTTETTSDIVSETPAEPATDKPKETKKAGRKAAGKAADSGKQKSKQSREKRMSPRQRRRR